MLYRFLEPYGFDSGTIGSLGDLLADWSSSPAGTVTLSGKTFEAPDFIAVTSASEIVITPRPCGTLPGPSAKTAKNAKGPLKMTGTFSENPGKVQKVPSKKAGPSAKTTKNAKGPLEMQKVQAKVYDKPSDFNPVMSEGTLVADADKLPLPLKVRPWQAGDWMVPLGMKGRKKLSDLFVDLKWNLLQKQEAQVVEHPDGKPGHVAALLCVRIDDSVKVTRATSRILSISL